MVPEQWNPWALNAILEENSPGQKSSKSWTPPSFHPSLPQMVGEAFAVYLVQCSTVENAQGTSQESLNSRSSHSSREDRQQ